MIRKIRNSVRKDQRRGAVMVETAVVFPVVVLFFFAQFELVRLNNIRNTVYLAAYEGAREGMLPGATVAEVESKTNAILASASAINSTVTVNPNPITDTDPSITVTVSVPLDDNSWTVPIYSAGKTLTASVTLTREKDDTVFVP